MLEVRASTNLGLIGAYCKKADVLPGEQFYLYLAKDGENQIAAGLFEVLSERVRVVFFEAEERDPWLLDAILRAGLNYAASHGVNTGEIPEDFRQTHRELFAKLNYPAPVEFDITNFFSKYKNCG